jgi:uncharacterized membrane protein
MSSGLVLLLAFGIGVVAGLRSITAPAVVSWAAYLGWINLSGSRLAFMASIWTVALFTFGAFVEYVADQLPSSPPRTAAPALTARICMGLLTGACLGIAIGASPWTAAALGRSAPLQEHLADIKFALDWFAVCAFPMPRLRFRKTSLRFLLGS